MLSQFYYFTNLDLPKIRGIPFLKDLIIYPNDLGISHIGCLDLSKRISVQFTATISLL